MQANAETDKRHKIWITDISNTCTIRHQNQKPNNNFTFINYHIIAYFESDEAGSQKSCYSTTHEIPHLSRKTEVHYRLTMVPILSLHLHLAQIQIFCFKVQKSDCLKHTFNYDWNSNNIRQQNQPFSLFYPSQAVICTSVAMHMCSSAGKTHLQYSTTLLRHLWNKTGNGYIT
jgi:hypothetical protein